MSSRVIGSVLACANCALMVDASLAVIVASVNDCKKLNCVVGLSARVVISSAMPTTNNPASELKSSNVIGSLMLSVKVHTCVFVSASPMFSSIVALNTALDNEA